MNRASQTASPKRRSHMERGARPCAAKVRSMERRARTRFGSNGVTAGAPDEFARPFEIGGSVDSERHAFDDRDIDAHAGFERAQLLELFAPLQRRPRQPDKARQRRTAIGVEPDMMVERALARGRGGAGEIERAQPHWGGTPG